MAAALGVVPLILSPQYARAESSAVDGKLPAFPGAEGFGAFTPGGRGGRVIEVTNLKPDGPGSLTAAPIGGETHLMSFLAATTTAGIGRRYTPIHADTAAAAHGSCLQRPVRC